MRRSATALLAALTLLASAPAQGATLDPALIAVGDWIFVGNSDTTVMFFKPVSSDGTLRQVLVRFEDGAPFTRENFSSLASLELDDVDCAALKTRILRSVRYTAHNLQGDSRADDLGEPVWKSEARGSFGAGLIAKVCADAV